MKSSHLRKILVLACMAWVLVGCTDKSKILSSENGWKTCPAEQLSKTISDDYRGFVNALPSDERALVDRANTFCYSNTNGKHAVRFEIPLHGNWTQHVVIYNKNDKRLKTFRYNRGRYAP